MPIKEIAVKGWLSVAFLAFFCVASASAAPRGGEILSGSGDLSDAYNIRQYTDSLRTSWNSFDISAGEEVRIHQPSSRSSIVIGVRNGVGTQIDGTLSANGRVVLENPAGVEFGAGSVVNVGGLLASASSGSVSAQGVINAPSGEVHLQSLSKGEVVNVGGAISADRIIVEGANEVRIGSSASLTANKEVLVGGDFQGKGDITNSQKTIVESGALITSPRVIIWSDVSTNFQGNIEAGNGFVEISGKKSLASFNLLNVKTGELLLDPTNIVITDNNGLRANMVDATDIGNIAEDDNAGETLYLLGGAIRVYLEANAGTTLSLAATENITVGATIDRGTTGNALARGNLTLTAPTITINENIELVSTSTFSPTLTITATGGVITFGSGVTLYADTIALSQVGAFGGTRPTSLKAYVYDGTNLGTTPTEAATLTTTDTTPIKTAGAINITDPDNDGITAQEIMDAITEKFDFTSGEFDVTTFNFTLSTAGNVVFPPALTGIRTTTGNITISIGGTFSWTPTTAGTAFTLTTTTSNNDFDNPIGNISLSGNFGVSGSDLTINSAGQLTLSSSRATTLTGASVTLTAVRQPFSTLKNLTIIAAAADGAVNINTSIFIYAPDVGGGDLVITAGTGGINFSTIPHLTDPANNAPTKRTISARTITLKQAKAFDPDSELPIRSDDTNPIISQTNATENYTRPRWASCLAGDSFCQAPPVPKADINVEQVGSITLTDVLGGFEIENGVLDLGTFDLTLITGGKIIVPSTLTRITTTGSITIATAANTHSTSNPSAGKNGDEDVFSTGGISGLSAGATLTIEITGGTVAADIDSSEIDLRIANVFAAQDDDGNHPAFDLILKTNGQLSMKVLSSFSGIISQAAIRATNLTLDAPYLEGFGNNAGVLSSVKIYGTNSITFKNLVKVSTATLQNNLILNVGMGGIIYPTTGTGANQADAFENYVVNIENTHNSSDPLVIRSWALLAKQIKITSETRPVLITGGVIANTLEITAPRIIFDGADDGAGGANDDIVITVAESIQLNATDDDTTTTAFTAISGDGNQNLTISQKAGARFTQFSIKGVYNLGDGGTLTLNIPNLTLADHIAVGSNITPIIQEINITELNAGAVVLNFIADEDGVNDRGYFLQVVTLNEILSSLRQEQLKFRVILRWHE